MHPRSKDFQLNLEVLMSIRYLSFVRQMTDYALKFNTPLPIAIGTLSGGECIIELYFK